MLKYFAIAALIWLIFIMFKKNKIHDNTTKNSTNEIIKCNRCGLHIAKNQAFVDKCGNTFCSKECL